jgi:hypothetical protein
VLQNHPKSIRTSARTSISRASASKYYAVAKCHFEGSELKKEVYPTFIVGFIRDELIRIVQKQTTIFR